MNLRALTIGQNWPARKKFGSDRCKKKSQRRSVHLLTRSLRGIHTKADVNDMVDLSKNFLIFILGENCISEISRILRPAGQL